MTTLQINRILAEYDGWEPHPEFLSAFRKDGYMRYDYELTYTTDWNEFHRIWQKWDGWDDKVANHIVYDDTPQQAATELANLIKNSKV